MFEQGINTSYVNNLYAKGPKTKSVTPTVQEIQPERPKSILEDMPKSYDVSSSGNRSFVDVVEQGLSSSIDTLKKSERVSMEGIKGEASIQEVVQAANNAEMTLNTVVALRDKVVQAYNDILRMPI